MPKLEFYVCRAGQSLEAYKADSEDNTEMGVIGYIYVWKGEWIRSPEECAGRDTMEIMRLYSLSTGRVCHGSLDSFGEIQANHWLVEWAVSTAV